MATPLPPVRRFLARLAVFVSLQAALAAVLVHRYTVDRGTYMSVTVDKNVRLQAASGPRLIVVGGSNVAFGIDSERLGDAFSLVPVNMGIHADLGLPFMIREARSGVRPGDVVLISPEYQLYNRNPRTSTFHVLEQRPASAAFVPLGYLPSLLDHAFVYMAVVARVGLWPPAAAQETPDRMYRRDGFAPNGDHVAHRGQRPPHVDLEFPPYSYSRWRARPLIAMLNAFARHCRGLGAVPYYAHPTIPQSTFREHEASLRAIDGLLRERLEIPMLNRPEEAVLPDTFFFDSSYHLTEEGTRLRTSRLVEALAAHGLRPADP